MADDTEVLVPQIHEDRLPGSEAKLEPKPDWHPRYPGSGRLKGKVALVTGADSGIGRAVAALFAREGADIAIIYLCEHEDAAKSKQIVEQEGRRAITIPGDIGSKDFCDKAVQQTIDAFGRLDLLDRNGAAAGRRPRDDPVTCKGATGSSHQYEEFSPGYPVVFLRGLSIHFLRGLFVHGYLLAGSD